MSRTRKLILFFSFLILITGLGSFYFSYYGIHYTISNQEIQNKIQQKLPINKMTSVGPIKINKISNLKIFNDGSVDFKIHGNINMQFHYYMNFVMEINGQLKYYKNTHILALLKPKLVDINIDDKNHPLTPHWLGRINQQTNQFIIGPYFYYAKAYNFNNHILTKIISNYIHKVYFKNNNMIIYLK